MHEEICTTIFMVIVVIIVMFVIYKLLRRKKKFGKIRSGMSPEKRNFIIAYLLGQNRR